jgi:hypothetical protein
MTTTTTTTTTQAPTTPTTINVQIRKDHSGQWTIEAEDTVENGKRFAKVKEIFNERRIARHQKHEPHHDPIVFNEGDTLTFTCTPPLEFAIGAKKDDVVDEVLDAPDNPFVGWNGLQTAGANSSVSGLVKRSAGVKEQAFYKFHGWVKENGSRVDVDPDGYCGS